MTTNSERRRASLLRRVERQLTWAAETVQRAEQAVAGLRDELIQTGISPESVDLWIAEARRTAKLPPDGVDTEAKPVV